MNPTLILLLLLATVASAQEIKQKLSAFDEVIASPHIHVVLSKGADEEIKLVYNHVDSSKINVKVKNRKLYIFLDNARVREKNQRGDNHRWSGVYDGASVTAYVTYRQLKHLEIRGEQQLTCLGPIEAEKFTLRAYGENEIVLSQVHTDFFKTKLYGENTLNIKSGKAAYQMYKLYGENDIDSRALKSYVASTSVFGESKLKLAIDDELKVSSFGQTEVSFSGKAEVNKGLIFGRTQIRKVVAD